MSRDIWFISDTHFNHENILNFKDSSGEIIRNFSCVEEMNVHIAECWNSVVKKGDKVYHLGDVFFGNKEEFKAFWPRLNGSKRLVVGNHDDVKFLSSGGFFQKVYESRTFGEFGFLASHRPLHQSGLKRYGRDTEYFLNVHGHIHHNKSPEGPYLNVSVEALNYTPINLDEVRSFVV